MAFDRCSVAIIFAIRIVNANCKLTCCTHLASFAVIFFFVILAKKWLQKVGGHLLESQCVF